LICFNKSSGSVCANHFKSTSCAQGCKFFKIFPWLGGAWRKEKLRHVAEQGGENSLCGGKKSPWLKIAMGKNSPVKIVQ
jgi:hypothetical protein